jgi:HTH-like domain
VLGQHRSTQRRRPKGPEDEEALVEDITELVRQYGRYDYRKIAELLRSTAGLVVNDKRVERIWRREGLKVPAKQPKKGGFGWQTAPASGCGPNGPTVSGAMILLNTAPMRERNTGC